MAVAQEAVLYIAGAVLCFGAVGIVLHWARPVNGEMSPKLRRGGMETLVGGVATLSGTIGLGFIIGAILATLKY